MNKEMILNILSTVLLLTLGVSGYTLYSQNNEEENLLVENNRLKDEIKKIDEEQLKKEDGYKGLVLEQEKMTHFAVTQLDELQSVQNELSKSNWVSFKQFKVLLSEFPSLQEKVAGIIQEINSNSGENRFLVNQEKLNSIKEFNEEVKKDIKIANQYSPETGSNLNEVQGYLFLSLVTEPLARIQELNNEKPLEKCNNSFNKRNEILNNIQIAENNLKIFSEKVRNLQWVSNKDVYSIGALNNALKYNLPKFLSLKDVMVTNKSDYSLVFDCEEIDKFFNEASINKKSSENLVSLIDNILPKIESESTSFCKRVSPMECDDAKNAVLLIMMTQSIAEASPNYKGKKFTVNELFTTSKPFVTPVNFPMLRQDRPIMYRTDISDRFRQNIEPSNYMGGR